VSEHLILFEYEVHGDHATEFEEVYGPGGSWVELFSSAGGYLGSELYRDADRAGRYLVVDRWRSAAEYRSFLDSRAADYDALGQRTQRLWRRERCIGAYEREED
jgi:heme-degrading monooxygenase HmoA